MGARAPVNLATILEYLCVEILELAGNAACDITKRHVLPLVTSYLLSRIMKNQTNCWLEFLVSQKNSER